MLTFHSWSEDKSENVSNVIDFVLDEEKFKPPFNKLIKAECQQLKSKYKNITFKGITATTKNKIKILKDFDVRFIR